MDEDKLNMSLRKFLKHVGVTSQREIERWASEAAADGKTSIRLRMELSAPGTDHTHVIEQDLEIG